MPTLHASSHLTPSCYCFLLQRTWLQHCVHLGSHDFETCCREDNFQASLQSNEFVLKYVGICRMWSVHLRRLAWRLKWKNHNKRQTQANSKSNTTSTIVAGYQCKPISTAHVTRLDGVKVLGTGLHSNLQGKLGKQQLSWERSPSRFASSTFFVSKRGADTSILWGLCFFCITGCPLFAAADRADSHTGWRCPRSGRDVTIPVSSHLMLRRFRGAPSLESRGAKDVPT